MDFIWLPIRILSGFLLVFTTGLGIFDGLMVSFKTDFIKKKFQ